MSRGIHKYIDVQAAYLSVSFWKKERIFSALRCKECMDDFTFASHGAVRVKG
jgi:hypothetical protein